MDRRSNIYFHNLLKNENFFHNSFDKLSSEQSLGFFKLFNWENSESYSFIIENPNVSQKFFGIQNLKEEIPNQALAILWAKSLRRGKEEIAFKMLELGIAPVHLNQEGMELVSCFKKENFYKAISKLEKEKIAFWQDSTSLTAINNNHFEFLENKNLLTTDFWQKNFITIFKDCLSSNQNGQSYLEIKKNEDKTRTQHLSYENNVWQNFLILFERFAKVTPIQDIFKIYEQSNSLCTTGNFKTRFPQIDNLLCEIVIDHYKNLDVSGKEQFVKSFPSQVLTNCYTQEIGYPLIQALELYNPYLDAFANWAKASFYEALDVKKIKEENLYYCFFQKYKYNTQKSPIPVLEFEKVKQHLGKDTLVLFDKIHQKTHLDKDLILELIHKAKNPKELQAFCKTYEERENLKEEVNLSKNNKLRVL